MAISPTTNGKAKNSGFRNGTNDENRAIKSEAERIYADAEERVRESFMFGKLGNRRFRRWANDRLLRELAPPLDASEIGGLFSPPPWGERSVPTPFEQLTEIGVHTAEIMAAWEPFRTIDMDVQARWLHNARSQGKSGHEKSSAAMVAWHKVEKQARNALRRSSSPLLQLFEAKILAFLEEIDNGGNRELVLEVTLPYHRLLLHGMSQFYGLISRTVASSACDQSPVMKMHITKATCRAQQQDHFTTGRQLSLCRFLEEAHNHCCLSAAAA